MQHPLRHPVSLQGCAKLPREPKLASFSRSSSRRSSVGTGGTAQHPAARAQQHTAPPTAYSTPRATPPSESPPPYTAPLAPPLRSRSVPHLVNLALTTSLPAHPPFLGPAHPTSSSARDRVRSSSAASLHALGAFPPLHPAGAAAAAAESSSDGEAFSRLAPLPPQAYVSVPHAGTDSDDDHDHDHDALEIRSRGAGAGATATARRSLNASAGSAVSQRRGGATGRTARRGATGAGLPSEAAPTPPPVRVAAPFSPHRDEL